MHKSLSSIRSPPSAPEQMYDNAIVCKYCQSHRISRFDKVHIIVAKSASTRRITSTESTMLQSVSPIFSSHRSDVRFDAASYLTDTSQAMVYLYHFQTPYFLVCWSRGTLERVGSSKER
ncbi:hypothetical protein KCV07_g245, partial [Aureobasidium melanogenum]